MRTSDSTLRPGIVAVLSSLGMLALFTARVAHADGAVLADRFTATTTAMTPRDATVRIDVRAWSDDDARAAVVEALAASSDADVDAAKALQALPTVGYVWPGDSSVGYAVKYAHRAAMPDGERITFVTDKRLGAYELKPWTLDSPGSQKNPAYSVIELYLDGAGKGDGTLSLAVDPKLDTEQGVVTLGTEAGSARVLTNARHEPKGYSAKGG